MTDSPKTKSQAAAQLQFKDVTSTSFGLVIGFVLPGLVALYTVGFWKDSVADAFQTFLTDESNVGLFLLLALAGLTLGLVVSAARWILFELMMDAIPGIYGDQISKDEWRRLAEDGRFVAFRAAVDETYRYHQFFGGLAIVAPAFFVGWLDVDLGQLNDLLLIAGLVAGEILLVLASISTRRSHLRYCKAILAKPVTS